MTVITKLNDNLTTFSSICFLMADQDQHLYNSIVNQRE